MVLSGSVALTSSLDVLSAIAAGKGPQRSLFALGYAGWAPDQLERELAAGAWVVVEADEGLLFDGRSSPNGSARSTARASTSEAAGRRLRPCRDTRRIRSA